jgi:hypothetical protein
MTAVRQFIKLSQTNNFITMKKKFLILAVVLFATTNVMAQEVHGVESKMVCTYNCNPDGSWEQWKLGREDMNPWFGYQFTNLNSIPVSVEVELYKKQKIRVSSNSSEHKDEFILVATKSFVLKSNESYVFKTEERGIDCYQCINAYSWIGHDYYYVKYKAYKLQ